MSTKNKTWNKKDFKLSPSKPLKNENDTDIPKEVRKSLISIKNVIKQQKKSFVVTDSLPPLSLLFTFVPYFIFFLDYLKLKGLNSIVPIRMILYVIVMSIERPDHVTTASIARFMTKTNYRYIQIELKRLSELGLLLRVYRDNTYYYYLSDEVYEELHKSLIKI